MRESDHLDMLSVRVPPLLLEQLTATARREHTSRSAFIREALSVALERSEGGGGPDGADQPRPAA